MGTQLVINDICLDHGVSINEGTKSIRFVSNLGTQVEWRLRWDLAPGNEDAGALMDQAKAFLESVAGGPGPLVSGRVAMEALETAMVIGDLVGRQQAR